MDGPYRIEALGPHHHRKAFDCGIKALDRYLREQATPETRRRVTACYVAVEAGTDQVVGYYTLAAVGILLGDLPEALAKRLPRYPSVPAARLGRLAVGQACQGRRLGAALLWDAATRATRSDVAMFALVVDAKDDQAEAFYRYHGFLAFGSLARQLILPLAKCAA